MQLLTASSELLASRSTADRLAATVAEMVPVAALTEEVRIETRTKLGDSHRSINQPLSAAHCLLPTACCPLPAAHCLLSLPAAHCLLPRAAVCSHCLLPTACCPLPAAHCLLSLPAAHCLLPTVCCPAPPPQLDVQALTASLRADVEVQAKAAHAVETERLVAKLHAHEREISALQDVVKVVRTPLSTGRSLDPTGQCSPGLLQQCSLPPMPHLQLPTGPPERRARARGGEGRAARLARRGQVTERHAQGAHPDARTVALPVTASMSMGMGRVMCNVHSARPRASCCSSSIEPPWQVFALWMVAHIVDDIYAMHVHDDSRNLANAKMVLSLQSDVHLCL
jgi:hypothetical protein